jgi:hypothetical protein
MKAGDYIPESKLYRSKCSVQNMVAKSQEAEGGMKNLF